MTGTLALTRGEEKVFDVSIVDNGVPLSLVGYTLISTEIWWRSREYPHARLTLIDGAGLEILNLTPDTPAEGEDADPQFRFRLSEAQTATFPRGTIAFAQQVVTNSAGVTTIIGPEYFTVS